MKKNSQNKKKLNGFKIISNGKIKKALNTRITYRNGD
jgi:hypothetical protein